MMLIILLQVNAYEFPRKFLQVIHKCLICVCVCVCVRARAHEVFFSAQNIGKQAMFEGPGIDNVKQGNHALCVCVCVCYFLTFV
jgi:hypothetical protein